MESSQLFSGRAYAFESDDKTSQEGDASFQVVEKICDFAGLKIKKEDIIDQHSNENFDEYIVESGDSLYSLKLSFDIKCKPLLDEIAFLKNNESQIIARHVKSGSHRVGSPVLFLLSSYNNGFDISEFGCLSVLENCGSLFMALHHFKNFKSENTLESYLDFMFSDFSMPNSSEILTSSVSKLHEIEVVENIFSLLRDEAFLIADSPFMNRGECCHGLLNQEGITTMFDLYKFKNLGFNFVGNSMFDLCFFIISSGFSQRNKTLFAKEYFDFYNMDFRESIEEFDLCMKMASCVFLSKLFFDFLIEETVYNNVRPEKLLSIAILFLNSYSHLQKLDCFEFIDEDLKRIITRPITEQEANPDNYE